MAGRRPIDMLPQVVNEVVSAASILQMGEPLS